MYSRRRVGRVLSGTPQNSAARKSTAKIAANMNFCSGATVIPGANS